MRNIIVVKLFIIAALGTIIIGCQTPYPGLGNADPGPVNAYEGPELSLDKVATIKCFTRQQRVGMATEGAYISKVDGICTAPVQNREIYSSEIHVLPGRHSLLVQRREDGFFAASNLTVTVGSGCVYRLRSDIIGTRCFFRIENAITVPSDNGENSTAGIDTSQDIRTSSTAKTIDDSEQQPTTSSSTKPPSKEVIAKCRKKADLGDAKSQYELAKYYYEGQGMQRDDGVAVKWLRGAAEQGYADAECALGAFYLYGRGVPQDYAEALKWLRKAAAQNNAEAQYGVGQCYFEGNGVKRDDSEAAKWFLKSANQGCALAQLNLAQCYNSALGVPRDNTEALKWFRKAAEQNNANAQYSLGQFYLFGIGIANDFTEAMKWFRKAAVNNNIEAQYRYGLVCKNGGQGVPQDYDEAAKWLHRAAIQNHAGAQNALGASYLTGSGVEKNYTTALAWLGKAAAQGFVKSKMLIGICYYNGTGVSQDYIKAVNYFRQAADQGDEEAQYLLAVCYNLGFGVPQNYIQAYVWCNWASAKGAKNIIQYRNDILTKMTPQQIDEAQRRSEEIPRKFTNQVEPRSETPVVKASGTGFIITTNGYIVTARHVIADAKQVKIMTRGGYVTAEIVQEDKYNDIAILKANGHFRPISLGTIAKIKLGDPVFTIGFPNTSIQGISPKLTKGEISSVAGAHDDPRHYQISVQVQPGNSGGALIDSKGNVVGIVISKLNDARTINITGSVPQNVNYALKSSYITALLENTPRVSTVRPEPHTQKREFNEIVKEAEESTVLILVY